MKKKMPAWIDTRDSNVDNCLRLIEYRYKVAQRQIDPIDIALRSAKGLEWLSTRKWNKYGKT